MIKKQYIAPHLTSVEFKTERGYATSDMALVNTMAEATNRFIEDRQYESNMWDDSRYGIVSIEDRTGGNSTYSLSNDGVWAENDNGGYF